MAIGKLEQELRAYFRCEAGSAAPPLDWWQRAVTRATATPRLVPGRGLAAWARNIMDILRINPRKPFWGVATMLVVLLMFAVVSYGAGAFIANFPGGMAAPPPTTGVPSTTTITNTTITMAEAPSNLGTVVSILVFVLLAGVAFVTLLVRWRRRTQVVIGDGVHLVTSSAATPISKDRATLISRFFRLGRSSQVAIATSVLLILLVIVTTVGTPMRGGPMQVLTVLGLIVLIALFLSFLTRGRRK